MDGVLARRQVSYGLPHESLVEVFNRGASRFEPDVRVPQIPNVRRRTIGDGMGPCEDGLSEAREFYQGN